MLAIWSFSIEPFTIFSLAIFLIMSWSLPWPLLSFRQLALRATSSHSLLPLALLSRWRTTHRTLRLSFSFSFSLLGPWPCSSGYSWMGKLLSRFSSSEGQSWMSCSASKQWDIYELWQTGKQSNYNGKLEGIIQYQSGMLPGRMIEMFTKKMEDLSKCKQELTEPQYNLMEDSISNPKEPNGHDGWQVQQPGSSSSSIDSSEMDNLKRESKSSSSLEGKNPPKESEILEKIRNNLISFKGLKKKQSQSGSRGRRGASPSSSHGNSESSHKKSEKHSEKRKRQIAGEVLAETKLMSAEQKSAYIRVKAKKEGILSSHELRIWVDTYEMIFNVEKELQSSAEKGQKYVSKKFAQQFMKYVKKNPREKKYKLRRICSMAFKELDLASQRIDPWLNRFMVQNSAQLKNVDLTEYSIPSVKPLQAEGEKATAKKTKREAKRNLISKEVKNQQVKAKRRLNVERARQVKYAKRKKLQQEKRKKCQPSPQVLSLERKQSSGDESVPSNSSSMPKPRRGRRKEEKRVIQPAHNIVKSLAEQKQSIVSGRQKQPIRQPQKPRIEQKAMDNLLKDTHPSKEQSKKSESRPVELNGHVKLQVQSSSYPESFQKRVAAKLDNAFRHVFETILKEKCEEFCLEEEELKQMYKQFGSHFLCKNETNRLLIPTLHLAVEESSRGSDLRSIKEVPNQKAKAITSEMQTQTQQKESKPQKTQSTSKLQDKPGSPFEILSQKMKQFIRDNPGSSERAIKEEAIRIATTAPGIMGRIREDSLTRWTRVFIDRHKPRLFSDEAKQDNSRSQAPKSIKMVAEQPRIVIKPQRPPISNLTTLKESQKSPNEEEGFVGSGSGSQAFKNFHIAMPKVSKPRIEGQSK